MEGSRMMEVEVSIIFTFFHTTANGRRYVYTLLPMKGDFTRTMFGGHVNIEVPELRPQHQDVGLLSLHTARAAVSELVFVDSYSEHARYVTVQNWNNIKKFEFYGTTVIHLHISENDVMQIMREFETATAALSNTTFIEHYLACPRLESLMAYCIARDSALQATVGAEPEEISRQLLDIAMPLNDLNELHHGRFTSWSQFYAGENLYPSPPIMNIFSMVTFVLDLLVHAGMQRMDME